ncbi:MAG: polysaccharide deacetylase family protein [Candidatus Pacearchaeota archaeon]
MNIFEHGAVSLSFDDGWLSGYENALPILVKHDFKGTFYVVSSYLDGKQFPRYMNKEHIRELAVKGNEIGSHTVSHKHLLAETSTIVWDELSIAKKYLEEIVGNVRTFAYPYGEYTSEVIDAVKKAGYLGARSTIRGWNNNSADPYLLKVQAVRVEVEPEEVYTWIDIAVKKNAWLILMFHQVDYEGRIWSTTPDKLENIASYISREKVRVITIDEGLRLINGFARI